MIADPKFAPRRNDLPFLRRRRRLPVVVEPSPARPTISFDRPDRRPAQPLAPATAASPGTPPPTPSSGAISFGRPDRHPAASSPPATPAAPAAPPAPSSLDLDAPAAPATPVPAPPASASLDLDASAPLVVAPVEPPRRVRDEPRVRAGARKILAVTAPTVTLTRLQSGIGTLVFEAAVSDAVGDLRIGCAYQLRSGESSTVQLAGGNRLAPPGSRRPIIVGGHDQFGRLSVDLRQSRELERMAIYAFSETRAPLTWGGTLIAETFGAARIELPLESLAGGDVAMLMSLYNVRGEFVLRAEMQALNGGVREACRAYGYDRITWLDDRTPVD
ncbi:MAG: hypothetical protein ABI429_09970 [Jatrophihabitantaceae bacterium]